MFNDMSYEAVKEQRALAAYGNGLARAGADIKHPSEYLSLGSPLYKGRHFSRQTKTEPFSYSSASTTKPAAFIGASATPRELNTVSPALVRRALGKELPAKTYGCAGCYSG